MLSYVGSFTKYGGAFYPLKGEKTQNGLPKFSSQQFLMQDFMTKFVSESFNFIPLYVLLQYIEFYSSLSYVITGVISMNCADRWGLGMASCRKQIWLRYSWIKKFFSQFMFVKLLNL